MKKEKSENKSRVVTDFLWSRKSLRVDPTESRLEREVYVCKKRFFARKLSFRHVTSSCLSCYIISCLRTRSAIVLFLKEEETCWRRILRRLLFFTFSRKRFDSKEREREKDIVHSLLWARLTKKFANFYELNHPKRRECRAINCSLSCLIPPDTDQKTVPLPKTTVSLVQYQKPSDCS